MLSPQQLLTACARAADPLDDETSARSTALMQPDATEHFQKPQNRSLLLESSRDKGDRGKAIRCATPRPTAGSCPRDVAIVATAAAAAAAAALAANPSAVGDEARSTSQSAMCQQKGDGKNC
ncbi:unnamed protein product [Closterium sp. NIES-54]